VKVYTTSDSYRKHVEREHKTELKYGAKFLVAAQKPNSSFLVSLRDFPSEHCKNNYTDAVDESNIGLIMQILTKNVAMFALRIREEHVLPKSTCTSILSRMSSLFDTFFEHFCKMVVARLEFNGIDTRVDPSFHHLLNEPEIIREVWINVESDAKLKRFCIEHLNLIEPAKVSFGCDEDTGKEHFFQYIFL